MAAGTAASAPPHSKTHRRPMRRRPLWGAPRAAPRTEALRMCARARRQQRVAAPPMAARWGRGGAAGADPERHSDAGDAGLASGATHVRPRGDGSSQDARYARIDSSSCKNCFVFSKVQGVFENALSVRKHTDSECCDSKFPHVLPVLSILTPGRDN